ncbi:hypothetical protein MCUN1_003210 [Malassezia cuniculi]|uniref:Pali-domain-containing protein n=1 Tax=Malassezia cuniculi TaxID=948313 RepID=A0AAF0JCW6_9BASI|nr:hypothetical protein MCUN1_003210 [Malassezia cuniculi]
MRPAISLGLICAIAGAVLLAIATFCAPINNSIWLFTVSTSGIDLHCGVFGYCVDSKCSETSLGYTFDRMSIPGTNASLPNKGALNSDLTYILVLYPVAFGLAVLAVVCAFVAQFHSMGFAVFAALLTLCSAIVATVGFAIVFVLFFYAKNHLEGNRSGVEYGTALWLSIAGAAVLYLASILLWAGVHLLRTKRVSSKNRSSYYRQLFAAPEHQSGITEPERTVLAESYPEEHYALQPSQAAAGLPYDTTNDMSLSQMDSTYATTTAPKPSNYCYLQGSANDTSLTLGGDSYGYGGQYSQPYIQPETYVHPDTYAQPGTYAGATEIYSDAQPYLVPDQPGGVQMVPLGSYAAGGYNTDTYDASALVPHVAQQQPPGYAQSNALQPEKRR